MSHLLGGAVLDVVERRCSKSAENLLNKTFTPQQREQICTINVDIWQPFLKAIQSQLPQALVVHDRFHLVKYLNECMDKVRRKDVATEDILKESRYALLKKEQNFMDKQRAKFKMIKTMNQEVTKVWYLRENFKSLFGISHNDSDAQGVLIERAQDAFMCGIKEVNKVILMLQSCRRRCKCLNK